MEKKLESIILNIQSVNDIITNSSSEVVIRYDKEGILKIKDLVNTLLSPFTSLMFDDLFTVTFIDEGYDYDDNEYSKEYEENDPELDAAINRSWERTYDDSFPTMSIKISVKEGKESMKHAADLLEKVATFFDTTIVYG
jgi:hypothetical protein